MKFDNLVGDRNCEISRNNAARHGSY